MRHLLPKSCLIMLSSMLLTMLTIGNIPAPTVLAFAPSPTPYGGGHGLIAFDSGIGSGGGGIITLLDLTTGLQHGLSPTSNDGHGYSWSPDGKYIAYTGIDQNGNYGIGVIDISTG